MRPAMLVVMNSTTEACFNRMFLVYIRKLLAVVALKPGREYIVVTSPLLSISGQPFDCQYPR